MPPSLFTVFVLILHAVWASPTILGHQFLGPRKLSDAAGPGSHYVSWNLSSQLSSGALVHSPDDSTFANMTARWSDFSLGSYAAVVEPATTDDVAACVKFANWHNIPFLVSTGGHGTTSFLKNIEFGLLIKLTKFQFVDVAADGQSAWIGGGTDNTQVVADLYDYGNKVTTTLVCGCPGFVGPALGGGFGKYQGHLGLLTDNILSMEVVLADGSITTVSNTSHPDLFWGMRGAGHNFGIVTKVKQRIYNNPVPSWFYAELQFTGDKFEAFSLVMNNISNGGSQPAAMASIYNLLWMNPSISTTEPVILSQFTFAGTEAEAQPYLTQLLSLGPATIKTNATLNPTQLAGVVGQDINGPVCALGASKRLNPVGLLEYNTTANLAVYNRYKQLVTQHPQFNNSVIQLENYSVVGVRTRIPWNATAYAHRADNIMVSLEATYPPSEENDEIGYAASKDIRDLFRQGSGGKPVTAYVNYAVGDEEMEMVYGWETWRIERLKDLKRRWDPRGRFGFYAPIPV